MSDNDNDVRIDAMIETSTTGEVPAEVETALKSRLGGFRLKIEQTRPGWLESVAAGIRLAFGQQEAAGFTRRRPAACSRPRRSSTPLS
jgi:hypothetical protein